MKKDYCKIGRIVEWSEEFPNGDIDTVCGVDEVAGTLYSECVNASILDDMCIYHRIGKDSCWNCRALIEHLPPHTRVLFAMGDL